MPTCMCVCVWVCGGCECEKGVTVAIAEYM